MSHAIADISTTTPADPMIAFLERALRDPAFSTEKAESVMKLLVEQQKRVHQRVFNYDMNLMQQEMLSIAADKANPVFRSRYATLDALDKVARPVYTKYGFSIRYGTRPASRDGWIQVTCTVAHRDGYFEEHSLEGPVSTQGSQGNRAGATPIQAVGSAVTYLKRYLLAMVLNLVTAVEVKDDNDGNGKHDTDPNAKYADWLQRFEQAAGELTDSDAAKELLERETVVKMITEIPGGELKRRFMELRAEISKKWLQPIDNAAENAAKTDTKIEGLD